MPQSSKSPRRRWPFLILVAGFALFLGAFAVYFTWALTFPMKEVETIKQRSAIYDMDGNYYTRLQGENRITTTFDKVSQNFVNALLAREDSRFHDHYGVDPVGIVRAVFRNLSTLSAKEGASTITQQLARNSFPLGGKTLNRKILEAFVAMRIERNFSKNEILADYMNRIYFGSGYYGVETASEAYFGKSASKLSLGESALLAGLIRSPNRFSPFNNLKASLAQRDTVLDRMVELKMVKESEAASAKRAQIRVSKKQTRVAQQNYALDAVRRDLDVVLREDQADEGGLRVYTTIDPALQKSLERSIDLQLKKIEQRSGFPHPKKSDFEKDPANAGGDTPYLQAAVVVIDNRTGAIRALAGGRDYGQSQYNRALVAQRQIGSTFKPFVYAAAYAKGMLPGAAIDDGPLQRAGWSPANSDRKNKGVLPASDGLVLSRNTMTVRVGDFAGIKAVEQMAVAVGLGEIPSSPTSYIGTFEATLRDVTAAFTIFPNDGLRRQTYMIERIDDEDGEPIYRAAHISAPAVDPGVAWMVSTALRDVMERGTGATVRSLGFRDPVGGKTGTTDDYRDAWFIGYTSSLTCGVWVGLDKPATIVSGGYGSTLALPIWADTMKAASVQRYPARSFEPPVDLQNVEVCSASNAIATTGCADRQTAYEIALPTNRIPQELCSLHPGRQLEAGGSRKDRPSRERSEGDLGRRIFRSFQNFFGR